MAYLIVNVGSSSKKYALWDNGEICRSWHFEDTDDHFENVASGIELDAIGFRIVHGGKFGKSLLITDEVLKELESIKGLAPLHNGPALEEIRAVKKLMPHVTLVAVFDTSFHKSMPEYARRYPLPEAVMSDPHHLVRHGFHGISYQSIIRKVNKRLGFIPARMIACHLGNGSSMCAMFHGKSIDTSMGFTPLEGLMMGTRSGDIDLGLIFHIQKEFNFSAEDMDHMLNYGAGLKGVAGEADLRILIDRSKRGDKKATLAIEMFSYRIKKYIGSYSAALGGLDVLVFTAGIGEGSPYLRSKFCKNMEFLGVDLDEKRNTTHKGDTEGEIQTKTSPVEILVLKTDEMTEIALQIDATIN